MRVFWEIVPATSCNFCCLNCYAADNARPDSKLLSWDEMKVVIDRAIALGVKQIDILGGEPLTCKCLERFIEYFKSRVKDGFCGVVSNGSLITKSRARSLFSSGLDQLSVSIDGTKARINDLNRGKGTFRQTLIGIENAVNIGIPLTIAYTITPFNTSDTPNLFSFAKKLGAKAISVQITEMLGRAKRTLSGFNSFNRFEGLKAVCKMYQRRPPLYSEVSTRSLFKEFLNYFFNAGLNLPDVRCDGGLKTLMISSGSNLYPCSIYAYFPDGRLKNEGVNLLFDDFDTIKEFVEHKYVRFNVKMRALGTKKFTTCQNCKYVISCAPCPLANPPGFVPECEWVKSQTEKLKDKILHSRFKFVIKPKLINNSEVGFLVPTQKPLLIIPMSEKRFRGLMTLKSVLQIVEMYKKKSGNGRDAEDKVIEFLCKLRSHQIIEIERFDTLLG